MKKRYQIIALLLCMCLLMGMLPGRVMAAEKEIDVGSDDSFDDIIELDHTVASSWEDIRTRFESAKGGQRVKVVVTGRVELPEVLKNSNGASFYIVGRGTDAIITPSLDVPQENFIGKYLFKVENGNRTAQLAIMNVTLDGSRTCGLLHVREYGTVCFGSNDNNPDAPVRFINASLTQGQGGAVRLGGICHAVIRDCTFENNIGNSSTVNTGCLYFSSASEKHGVKCPGMFITNCQFRNNSGHSGGAMYVYGRNAYTYIDRFTTFEGNYAGQRGGAIHCHGTVFVDGASFIGNHCDGLGGAIYVSASKIMSDSDVEQNFYGTLLLNGWSDSTGPMKMKGNIAGTVGGAVYIAQDAVTLLMGNLDIRENYLGRYVDDPAFDYAGSDAHRTSNIYTVGTGGHIVLLPSMLEYTKGSEMVGLSTSSPTIGTNLVLSPWNLTQLYTGLANKADVDRIGYDKIIENLNGDYANYTLAIEHLNNDAANEYLPKNAAVFSLDDYRSGSDQAKKLYREAPDKFFYDGDLLEVEHNTDPESLGMLKLNYNQKYLTASGKSAVIFDYNLPGKAAQVMSGMPGSMVTPPKVTVPTTVQNSVTYTFKGWFTKPEGGTRLADDAQVKIEKEPKVYYAQWEITPPVSEETVVGDMKLIYFDQNISGGGVTAAYVTFGTFRFSFTR